VRSEAGVGAGDAGAGLFNPCGGVLREGIPMRYRAIPSGSCAGRSRSRLRANTPGPAGRESPRSGHTRARLSASRVFQRESRETSGSPSIWDALVQRGHGVGEHRIARLMPVEGILAKTVTQWRATIPSNHRWPVADNTLARQFTGEPSNLVWARDLIDV